MTELAQRRAEAEAKKAEATRAAGAAILDGRKPDVGVIANLDAELQAIDAAQSEQSRRERDAMDAAHRQRLDANRAKLAALMADQVRDTQEAETHARGLAAANGRIITRNAEIAKLAHEISGKRTPIPLQAPELISRMAGRLCAVMRTTHPSHRHRFGSIMWHPGVHTADQSWRDAEAALLEKHLNPVLGKEPQ